MTVAEPHKKKEEEPAIVAAALLAGAWKEALEEYDYKNLLAETLSYCVKKRDMDLVGYLITGKKVYLVVFIKPSKLGAMLSVFFTELKQRLDDWKREQKHKATLFHNSTTTLVLPASAEALFVRRPFSDPYLLSLITGHEVDLPYYDPQLERLKDRIKAERFCSAVDYSGGKGPVVLPEELNRADRYIE